MSEAIVSSIIIDNQGWSSGDENSDAKKKKKNSLLTRAHISVIQKFQTSRYHIDRPTLIVTAPKPLFVFGTTHRHASPWHHYQQPHPTNLRNGIDDSCYVKINTDSIQNRSREEKVQTEMDGPTILIGKMTTDIAYKVPKVGK